MAMTAQWLFYNYIMIENYTFLRIESQSLKFLYFWQVVVSAKCLFGEKSVRHTVRSTKCLFDIGYVHTVTFSHRFLLFGSKLEFPWDCGTIQSHAKTLPCARSLSVRRQNVRSEKCLSAKCLSAKCLSAKCPGTSCTIIRNKFVVMKFL